MAKKQPREGTPAWEESLNQNPTYVRNTIHSLVERAERGDRQAVENLLGWLERHPDMRSLVRGLDDLATKVERCWIDRVCGADELAKKALLDEVAAMKAELLGPAPSVLDKILASTVLVAHLSYQRAAHVAAMKVENLVEQEARERRLSASQKRLVAAVKEWEQIAGKKAKGLRPRGKLKLFEPGVAA